MKRALVLAPHTDDAEFGCGGTIAKLRKSGEWQVRVVAFTSCGDKRLNKEFAQSMNHLGVIERMVLDFPVRLFNSLRQEILDQMVLMAAWEPHVVYTPNTDDVHQDHQVVTEEARRAFKGCTMLGYELPWNSYRFPTTAYEVLEPEHLDAKVAAMRCYHSQSERPYANEEFLRSLAVVRGTSIKARYAEAFEVIRMVNR
jgi:LmbE family N-acetylglucosaminyl deacetylase